MHFSAVYRLRRI